MSLYQHYIPQTNLYREHVKVKWPTVKSMTTSWSQVHYVTCRRTLHSRL